MGRGAGPRPPMALARCCLVPATPQREESPSFPSSLSEEEPFPFATADRGTGQQTTGGKKEGFFITPAPLLSQKEAFSRRCGGKGRFLHVGKSRSNSSRRSASLPGFFFFFFLPLCSLGSASASSVACGCSFGFGSMWRQTVKGERKRQQQRGGGSITLRPSSAGRRRPTLLLLCARLPPTDRPRSATLLEKDEEGKTVEDHASLLDLKPPPHAIKEDGGREEGGIKQWPHRTAPHAGGGGIAP